MGILDKIRVFFSDLSQNRIKLYGLIGAVCVVILMLGIYFQFFYSPNDDMKFGIDNKVETSTEYEKLKNDFNSEFNNAVRRIRQDSTSYNKIDQTKDIVYTTANLDIESQGKYDINIHLPALNLSGDVAQQITKDINNLFGALANTVAASEDYLTVYNLDYVAYLNDEILSLVIKATLKEGDKPQRVMIKTYNYNIAKNTYVTLGTLINKKNLDKQQVQDKIYSEINTIIKENEALEKEGYTVYKRNISDSMYELENTDTYFIDSNGYLYIVYCYGNTKYSGEVDLIIF